MGNKNLDRKPMNVMDKLCKIQEQFGDAVVFQIGITKNAKGKVIDIISAKPRRFGNTDFRASFIFPHSKILIRRNGSYFCVPIKV